MQSIKQCRKLTAVVMPFDRLGVGWLNWEGYHEGRRCSWDTYPESYITEYTSIRIEELAAVVS